jgi:peptidoglycan/xylan/chitin deacetylase (PgdA/CDA1 family)
MWLSSTQQLDNYWPIFPSGVPPMVFILLIVRLCFKTGILALSCALNAAVHAAEAVQACKATVYLTLDTGAMHQADNIAAILNKHQVKATFFLANEKTYRGDYALDASWGDYWRARVAEGHAFGSHTFDHVYFKTSAATASPADLKLKPAALHMARPQFGSLAGRTVYWRDDQVCAELDRVNSRFQEITGHSLKGLWRAPGGRAPAGVMAAGRACGYQHVFWAPAGFLGDELPSESFSGWLEGR